MYSMYQLGCVSGIGASQTVGDECPTFGLCGAGLYCADDQTCQKESPIGGKCNMTAQDSGCPAYSMCSNKSASILNPRILETLASIP